MTLVTLFQLGPYSQFHHRHKRQLQHFGSLSSPTWSDEVTLNTATIRSPIKITPTTTTTARVNNLIRGWGKQQFSDLFQLTPIAMWQPAFLLLRFNHVHTPCTTHTKPMDHARSHQAIAKDGRQSRSSHSWWLAHDWLEEVKTGGFVF